MTDASANMNAEQTTRLFRVVEVRSNRRLVFIFACTVMLITTLPYIFGYASQGDTWRYTGFLFGVEDGNSYIAKMLSGAAGSWLFRTPYTTFPQNGVIAFLPYLMLGKLAQPPGMHEQLVALFHLFRFIAGLLAIVATNDFLGLFITDPVKRWQALILAILGGGLGWVLVLLGRSTWLGSLPLEFYSPESFGFLAIYGLPHLALARALLLWGFYCYLRRPDNANKSILLPVVRFKYIINRPGILSGLLWLVMGFVQPLTVVVAWVVVFTHLGFLFIWRFWRKQTGSIPDWHTWWLYCTRGLWAVGLSSPMVIYTFLTFNSDPFLRNWTSQNVITSPHPLHYLIAYGLLIPFALIGALHLIRQDGFLGWFPVGWVLLLPFLAYAPYNLQRRLPEGIWVAIVLLGVIGWGHLLEMVFSRKRSGIQFIRKNGAVILIGLMLPSTLFLLSGGMLSAIHPGEPLYQPVAEIKAFQFLAEHASPGEAVLAAFPTSNALPAWVPLRVVIGHGPESVGLVDLIPRITAFYEANTPDSFRKDFLEDVGAQYVLWGPEERALGNWNPQEAEYLRIIYQNDQYMLFRFSPQIPAKANQFIPTIIRQLSR